MALLLLHVEGQTFNVQLEDLDAVAAALSLASAARIIAIDQDIQAEKDPELILAGTEALVKIGALVEFGRDHERARKVSK